MRNEECAQVFLELLVRVEKLALDRGLPYCPVYALNQPVLPRVANFGETMLDVVVSTDAAQGVNRGIKALFAIGERHAVVSQDGVDSVRYPGQQVEMEFLGNRPCLFRI